MSTQSMKCPGCEKGTINFTVEDLIFGKSFECNICGISVGLGSQDKKVNETFKKIERRLE